MGVRVAYGRRCNIDNAIKDGTIPKGSIIITKDDADSELLFYDPSGKLKTIAERTRFDSLTEAEYWAQQYPCCGFVFAVKNGNGWVPYIVNNDNSLSPIKGESVGGVKLSDIEQDEVLVLDGGNAVI